MELSFAKNNETPVVPVTPEINQTVGLVTTAPLPVATYDGGFDDSDIAIEDIVIPRINLIHKVGGLSEVFNAGEFVLNATTVLHVPDNREKNIVGSGPLVIVPIGFKKISFCEKTAGGARGRMLKSEAEVVANNGTLDYNEAKASKGAKALFERYAVCLILIQRPAELLPDEEEQIFTHRIGDERYTLAQYASRGTAYTSFAKKLMTEKKIGFLREGGYTSFNWYLTSFQKSYPKEGGGVNWVPVPLLKPGARTTQAVRDYIREGLGFGN